MADSRHRQAARPRRRLRLATAVLPIAGCLTLAVTVGAVVLDRADTPPVVAARSDVAAASVLEQAGQQPVSRSADRAPLANEAAAEEKVEGQMYAADTATVLADADPASPVLAEIGKGDPVDVTGVVSGEWTQIMHNGLPRWVATDGVVKDKPLGTTPCAAGSAVERGLRPDTVKVYRAVCAEFPSILRYGGTSGRGEHATGQALDIMLDTTTGNGVASFLQEHRAELGIEYLIWRQRIWRPSTSPSWRHMASRGSATANHYDHVHVTTYGNAAR